MAAAEGRWLCWLKSCLPLQLHIKHKGVSPMLFNEELLPGIPAAVQRLATREAVVSEEVGLASLKGSPLPTHL